MTCWKLPSVPTVGNVCDLEATANWLTKNEKAERLNIGSIGFCSGGRQGRGLSKWPIR